MLTWLRKNMKTIMIVVAVLFAASMFYGLGYRGFKGGEKKTNVLAKVNGKEVDPFRYREMLNRVAQGFRGEINPQDLAFIENLALGQAIDFTLMLNEAKKRVRVSGREVDAAVDGIMQQQKIPSKRELENALKRMGFSLGKFRDFIRDDIMVQKLSMKLREEVRVTPDDLREVLRKFPGEKEPEKVALREKQEKAFRRWYSEVRSKAKIEIVSPELKGNDLRFKGRVQEAVEEYKKAILENPANPYLHVFLGDSYLALGRKDLAFSEYENAIKIEGGNPELYIILGKAYEDAGPKDLAATQYRKASLIAGDNKRLHERLLKLFQGMKRSREVALEKEEIKRIEKKEKFEKELKGQ